MPATRRSNRKTKRSSVDKDKNSEPDDQLPSAAAAGGEGSVAGEEKAAKRAKTTAVLLEESDSAVAASAAVLENDAFERTAKMLTLILAADYDEAESEDDEREAGQGEGVRKVTGGLEVDMKRRHQGTFFYNFCGGKVGVAWKLVREGETERDACPSALRSQPVSSLISSSSSSSSSSS